MQRTPHASYIQGSYAVWESMEFNFSHYQVWMSIEKRKESTGKDSCFQPIAPLPLYKIQNSECLEQAASRAKMLTTVCERVGQSQLDVVKSRVRSPKCLMNLPNLDICNIHIALQITKYYLCLNIFELCGDVVIRKLSFCVRKTLWLCSLSFTWTL